MPAEREDPVWGQGWGLLYPRRGDAQTTPWPRDFDIFSKCRFEGFESTLDLIIGARCRTAAPGRKTEDNTPKRLDDHRHRDRVSRHRCWKSSLRALHNANNPLSCPDPHCKSRMKIIRTKKRVFSHSAVTAVPLSPKEEQDRTHDNAIESLVKNSKRSNTAH